MDVTHNEVDALSLLLRTQRAWADRAGIPLDADGYVHHRSKNLFEELTDATFAEFDAGSGGELGKDGKRGKMQALHSSSAFACNLFGYWRDRDPSRLARALGAPAGAWALSFERKAATGVHRATANLDVWLQAGDGAIVAVESKFGEPYRPKRGRSVLPSAYGLTSTGSAWIDAGLERCHEIAARTQREEVRWDSLDVFQLLKHLLALRRIDTGSASLRYVWFDMENEAARKHQLEIDRFVALLEGEGRFASVTHQQVVKKLRETNRDRDSAYFNYLATRHGL